MQTLISDTLNLFYEWLANRRAYEDNLGVSFCVFQKDKILYEAGIGYADLENRKSVTTDTVFRVASISKLFTATAIMQLVESNKLSLSDKVKELLPDFEIGYSIDYQNITVWHLLTHSSGLPRETNHSSWVHLKFPNKEETIAGFKRQEQVLRTNTTWKYSNLAYAMLGDIVAKIADMSFEEYIEKNIFQRLGLTHSFFRNMKANSILLANGYSRALPFTSRKKIPFAECDYLASAANLCSNVKDLTLFMQSFFNGKSALLRQETIHEMIHCQVVNHSWSDGYGLGFKFLRHNQNSLIGHGGAFQGFMSQLTYNRENDIGFVALTNSTDSEPLIFVKTAYDFILPTVAQAHQYSLTKVQTAWMKFVGRYRSAWRDGYVQFYRGDLCFFSIKDAKPIELRAILEPIDNQQFRYRSTIGGQAIGEKVVFEEVNGIVKKIWIGSSSMLKIDEWVSVVEDEIQIQ